jgi:hypothetical protein
MPECSTPFLEVGYPFLEFVPALDVHTHVVESDAREHEGVIARRLLPLPESDHETGPMQT